MSFTNSSSNFWLEDNHILHASCVDNDGNSHDSQLDLDHYIGNSDGWFAWDGVNFSKTASNVQLQGSQLTAELATLSGEPRERQVINLDERIGNNNGQLAYS
ncbi:uncharacterized protein UV8b_05534 [Ustilaginoidea virens]|uniref:Cyanovirin-N domain-containing protein n=1 Tax=Ustilaginoidea virens TaxID=1159556 RepID=A0A8E5MJ01_USTVR|nr:uncharacterized protein UV8b_05534 [Ustilaginoidea virens]QUC21291.1 hypothetical protein UV8b_05534 [Ustilaginoidea virens]